MFDTLVTSWVSVDVTDARKLTCSGFATNCRLIGSVSRRLLDEMASGLLFRGQKTARESPAFAKVHVEDDPQVRTMLVEERCHCSPVGRLH